MVLRAARLNTQSGADGGTSKAGLGRHILTSEPAGVDTAVAWPGSGPETSSPEWGTHPASAIAKTSDIWRGMRRQMIGQEIRQLIPE